MADEIADDRFEQMLLDEEMADTPEPEHSTVVN
jgi:hypothetical protein